MVLRLHSQFLAQLLVRFLGSVALGALAPVCGAAFAQEVPVPALTAAPAADAVAVAPAATNAADPAQASAAVAPQAPVSLTTSADVVPASPPPYALLPPELPPVVVTLDKPVSAPEILPPELPPVVVEFGPVTAPRKADALPVAPSAPVLAPVALPVPAPFATAPVASVEPPIQLSHDDMRIAAEAFLRSELPQGLRAPQQVQALRKERETLVAFYAQRDNAPLWYVDGHWTAAAQAVLLRLVLAGEDGLDLAAYSLPQAQVASSQAAALSELRLSEAVVAYARQASGSRVDPARLSSLITARPIVPDATRVLANMVAARDAGAALLQYNPPHPAYRNLRAKLAELRQPGRVSTAANIAIPPGVALRVGMQDERVPLLRARFGLADTGIAPLVYDQQVAAAVADFQRANSLPANGVLTARTVAALGGGEPVRLENEIIANMERWRWMPRDMGDSRIEVNIPEYMVTVFRDNGVIHRTRAVVGKPDTPTPVFSENMRYLIVNPSWNVPQSIIEKEMLPKLANDPNYLARQGFEVAQNGDQLTVRQPPGERNALGRIKFMFPNQHSVYLHDTPSRALFANEKRAYSHGCVRVDQPFKLAEVVLGAGSGWSEERVRALVGGGERSLFLPKPLPIHIMYFTAIADDTGNVSLKEDIYGYSRRVKAALGLEGEAYVELPRKPARSTMRAKPKLRLARPAPAAPVAHPPMTVATIPAKPKSFFSWIVGE